MRTIFHVDMDAFVSVEELFDPSLKGKAVVVGGQKGERGVVSAASYEARKFGVHSALPLRTAAALCITRSFWMGIRTGTGSIRARVHGVLMEFSPKVEMASVDEAYMDLTGTERLLGPPLRAAHALHERMKQCTGLNCSNWDRDFTDGGEGVFRSGQTERGAVDSAGAGGGVSGAA